MQKLRVNSSLVVQEGTIDSVFRQDGYRHLRFRGDKRYECLVQQPTMHQILFLVGIVKKDVVTQVQGTLEILERYEQRLLTCREHEELWRLYKERDKIRRYAERRVWEFNGGE
jgi:hypothetical protein